VEGKCPCLIGEDWMIYDEKGSEGERMDQRIKFDRREEEV